jgi:hypothetical protein
LVHCRGRAGGLLKSHHVVVQRLESTGQDGQDRGRSSPSDLRREANMAYQPWRRLSSWTSRTEQGSLQVVEALDDEDHHLAQAHNLLDTTARDGGMRNVLKVETREVPQTYPSLALPLSRVVPN